MTVFLYFATLLAFSVLFTLEVIAPASGASCDKRWMIYAGILGALQIGVTLIAGILFRDWFQAHALLQLSPELPAIAVGALAFFLASFFAYWWHRASHHSDLLWRVFHQIHHSPSRIESLTAFFLHPLDGVAATLVNALCAYLLLGASTDAAAWGLLFAALYNLYIHADLNSPYWLGYFIQRPEMHRVHHKSDYHAGNYSLPLWDLLFGTWENPRERVLQCGFAPDKERMLTSMLKMQDVHAKSNDVSQ